MDMVERIRIGLALYIESYQQSDSEALRMRLEGFVNGDDISSIDSDVLRAQVDYWAYDFLNRQVERGRISRNQSYDLTVWYDEEKQK